MEASPFALEITPNTYSSDFGFEKERSLPTVMSKPNFIYNEEGHRVTVILDGYLHIHNLLEGEESTVRDGDLGKIVTATSPPNQGMNQIIIGNSRGLVGESFGKFLQQTKELFKEEIVAKKVSGLFTEFEFSNFEDGVLSQFAEKLLGNIRTYKRDSLVEIGSFIFDNQFNHNVLSEALKWIGFEETLPESLLRFSILLESLSNSSKFVRDAAGVGLSYFGDKRAIKYLNKAIEIESILSLKEDFQMVVDELIEG